MICLKICDAKIRIFFNIASFFRTFVNWRRFTAVSDAIFEEYAKGDTPGLRLPNEEVEREWEILSPHR